MVQRIAPFCGSSVTSEHNKIFLEGVKAALSVDDAFRGGWYNEQPVKGLCAAARVYVGWGLSQAFYWNQVYRELGYSSLEDFLVGFREGFFLPRRPRRQQPAHDAVDVATRRCRPDPRVGRRHGDTATRRHGDTAAALRSITARRRSCCRRKDLYFPPEDERWACQHLSNAEHRVIPGVWGHFAGGGANSVDTGFIDAALKELLAR